MVLTIHHMLIIKCLHLICGVEGLSLLKIHLQHCREDHAKLHSSLVENSFHGIKCCLLLVDTDAVVRVEGDTIPMVDEFIPTHSQCMLLVLVIVKFHYHGTWSGVGSRARRAKAVHPVQDRRGREQIASQDLSKKA